MPNSYTNVSRGAIIIGDDQSNNREPTPDRALNALTNLLKDVIDGLTMVELYPKDGRVSERFLNAGADRAVCVAEETPDDHVDADGMIWLPMDPLEFMEEERVQDVGLVYSSPPEGADQNREILDRLKAATILQDNCLVVLEEPAWNYTKLDDFQFLEQIEVSDYDRTKVTVCQMVSPMGI